MKTALITGASGGIGAALAEKFFSEGYFTVAAYNKGKDRVYALKERLGERGELLFPVFSDLSAKGGAKILYDYAEKNFGHVDVLVCNAGADLYKLAAETSEEEFSALTQVNLTSAFSLSSLCLNKMSERNRGKIIFVSSVWGIAGAAMESAYSAGKAALIGLTKSLAKEAGPAGVNVNCVCPGVIDTPMNSRFSAEEITALKERTPLGRLGAPREIAELVYFLSSDKADFITGQAIAADGGFIL